MKSRLLLSVWLVSLSFTSVMFAPGNQLKNQVARDLDDLLCNFQETIDEWNKAINTHNEREIIAILQMCPRFANQEFNYHGYRTYVLNYAAENNLHSLMRFLLNDKKRLKLNLETKDSRNECTALMRAAFRGHIDIVKELLSLKNFDGSLVVDVNHQRNGGNTALILAVFNGHIGVVKELLSLKNLDGSLIVNVNHHNSDGFTALIWAALRGHIDVVKELLSLKNLDGSLIVNVNYQNSYGFTALIGAAWVGYVEIVKELLQAGADINIKNQKGKTAFDMAQDENYLEVVKILKDYLEKKLK